MSSVKVKYFTVSGVDLKNTVSVVDTLIFHDALLTLMTDKICLLEDGCRVSGGGGILSVGCQAFFALNVGCRMLNFGNVRCRNNPFHGPFYLLRQKTTALIN